jgi:hypothetical protein
MHRERFVGGEIWVHEEERCELWKLQNVRESALERKDSFGDVLFGGKWANSR